jgi:hypothetical protein
LTRLPRSYSDDPSRILAALTRERTSTLLAEAEASRGARQARLHRQRAGTPDARKMPLRWVPDWLRPGGRHLPGRWPRWTPRDRRVILRDGSEVLIRRIQSTDAPLLADGLAQLSAKSRWIRVTITPITLLTMVMACAVLVPTDGSAPDAA